MRFEVASSPTRHTHILITRQPADRSRDDTRASRARFVATFPLHESPSGGLFTATGRITPA